MTTSNQELQHHVNDIINTLEHPPLLCQDCGHTYHDTDGEMNTCPECDSIDYAHMTGFDYLADVLDTEWILNADKSLKGARVLVAFGGPNIWVSTANNTVEGHWWSDSASGHYEDNIGLGDAVIDWFDC